MCIKDIVNNNFRLMKLDELKNMFHSDFNWFQYYKLLSTIPKKWKDLLKQNLHIDLENCTVADHIFVILENKNKNKILRAKLLKKVGLLPTRIFEKWNNFIPNHDPNWANIFSLAFKCAIDSKTRNFHFKFLHRIIATNDFLCKLGIIDNNKCTFCDEEVETLEHIFFDCNIVKTFWDQFTNWIRSKTLIDVEYSKENIFLGFNVNNPPLAINNLILLAKQFIYRCKCQKSKPKMSSFLHNIDLLIQIEKIIASNKNKLSAHYCKWEDFL